MILPFSRIVEWVCCVDGSVEVPIDVRRIISQRMVDARKEENRSESGDP